MSARAPSPGQAWSLTLLQTKMTPPVPPRGRVARCALRHRLEQAMQRRLTLVAAPAGFGKTTLLREWCDELRARAHAVGWLSIDAEDDDLAQFGAYLLACLRQGSGVGERAEALLREDPMTPVSSVVSVLLNEIGARGTPVFLVLDDFDRLASRAIRALVLRLLRYAPPNLHLLMGVRREPGLNLAELQAQGQLLHIGTDELRFTVADAQAFFGQAGGVALDAASVQLLHGATEGWVTGLQLASLALGQSADATQVAQELATHRFGIDAYLENTVLAPLTPALRQFALRTSVLERLGPGVCDAVMGGGNHSWERLEWLERNNFFLHAVDEQRRWYRYHALMAAALRRRAERSLGAELPALHRRASAWFAQQRLWPEAVRHALACGDVGNAASWVEDAALALIGRSDVRTVLGWLAMLPPDLVQERRRLRLARIWAQALSLHTSEAAEAVALLAREVGSPPAGADLSLAAEVSAVSALIAGLMDDSPRSLELGRLALAQAPCDAPSWVRRFAKTALVFGLPYAGRFDEVQRLIGEDRPDGDGGQSVYADVYCSSMYGLSALVQGRIAEAAATFEAALAQAEGLAGRDSAAAVLPAGYLANICYERNDLQRVQQLTEGRTAMAMQACALGSLQRYCRASARLLARRGDVAAALVILDEGRELAAARQWLRLRASCDAEAVRLHLGRGELAQARRVVEELQAAMPAQEPLPPGSFLETYASHAFAQARLALAEGRAARAVELLERTRARLQAAGMAYLEALAALMLALALEQRGRRAEALAALQAALAYAQVHGMLGSFIDEGAPMRALLRAWQARCSPRHAGLAPLVDQLAALMAAPAGPQPPRPPAPAATASPLLSTREIEVLTHISRGLSNKEVARALHVAPETVKWHLKNIFEKLNVGSRIEAVQSGLGLLR
jgi:LuxR family maltose regulon positive regulatory protein